MEGREKTRQKEMKLNGITPQMKGDNSRVESRRNKVRSSQGRSAATGTDTGARDSVQISDSTKDAAQARKVLNQTPDVRADRVSELKEKVESGTYKTSPYDIADKMLASFMEGNL